MGSGLEKIKILCLHGFLGLPSDWDLIQSHFMVSPLAGRFEWLSVDYMKSPELGPQKNFQDWAQSFNHWVRSQAPSGPRFLVGYSLGGRLALQAFKAAPNLYEGAVFVSTNPGLQKDKDHYDRAQKDQQWSEKFLTSSWPELMAEWNAQAVFKDSLSEPQRQEADYDRNHLAQVLTEWSLARQEDFREFIVQQQKQILWVSGERDLKFASLTMELQKRAPDLQAEILTKASHRVLFDQPGVLAAKMITFIQEKGKPV